MKTLFAASEMFPFVKTGGLADVANSLPKELLKHIDISVVLPMYGFLDLKGLKKFTDLEIVLGGVSYPIEIYLKYEEKLPVYFVKAPLLSATEDLYGDQHGDYSNNDLRFGIFCRAIVALCEELEIEVLHLNDWHTALSALYIKEEALEIKTVFTIHNLAYQGIFPAKSCERLGIDYKYFTMDTLEYYGQLNCMKAGIAYSDAVTTVSPSYAQEILTPEFGCGLDGFLQHYSEKLSGVLNGINTELFNPGKDPMIKEHYSAKKPENKYENKVVFMKESTLKDPRKPLFVVLSRLVEQKGIDLIIKILPELLEQKVNCFVLGDGDNEYSKKLENLAKTHSNLEFQNCYNEELSHKAYAAADFLLMPSRFEPCGLVQMIAMRYGVVPIVYATGGLKDSVHEGKELCGQGFVFDKYTKKSLLGAIERGLKLKKATKKFKKLQIDNMNCDFSFAEGAKKYLEIYKS